MRKCLLLVFTCACSILHAQNAVIKVAGNYFKTSPFEKEFSQFLQQLLSDPSLSNKNTRKKTDSTLFFFEGRYGTYNPFFFKPIQTRVILAEKEQVVVQDSLSILHTIYEYQLIGYAPPGIQGINDVKQEFDKINRRFMKDFSSYESSELKKGGLIRDYMYTSFPFYPFTLAWASNTDHTENIFAITVRFQVADNWAYLPFIVKD